MIDPLRLLAVTAIALSAVCCRARADSPQRTRDYTFGWWPNGFRTEKSDQSPVVFCVESGRYAFTLDLADFTKARLGPIDGPGYLAASQSGAQKLSELAAVPLRVEIEHQGKVYHAVRCLAGRERNPRHVILLESGRFVQHHRFLGIEFVDDQGRSLETNSTLELVAWPSSLTFALKTAPDSAYAEGPCPGVVGLGRAVRGHPLDIAHSPELDPPLLTLEAWVRVPDKLAHLNRNHWLIGKNANEWQQGNFGFLLNRDTVSAILNVGGGRQNEHRVEARGALTPGPWHHLALTYDGNTLRLYVDGRPAGANKVGKPRTPGRGQLRLGGRPDGFGQPVHALFDEVRIWQRALSATELAAHARKPGKLDPTGLSWSMSFEAKTNQGTTFAAPNLDGAKVRLGLGEWEVEETVAGRWAFGQAKEFLLHCPVEEEAWRAAPLEFAAQSAGQTYETRYTAGVGAYVVTVPDFKRDWPTGYTDIRNYDEVQLHVVNKGAQTHHVPVLFDVKRPAQITGQTPILCDADGRPTGIPVQLSKNWHHGAYSKFYAILPVAPGATDYRLRIAYGFWGTLPAASHAQLSLFGYGGNGRWDQLAIGCWGEVMCFDMDNSLTPMMVTDVRMLMTRNGKNGRKWSWSDGGWGGDWLGVFRGGKEKLHPVELKTAYLAHGPCLTDVRYAGAYGSQRDVPFTAQVATLRTEDHNRVFQQFRYRFAKPVAATGAHLFKMGPTRTLLTPRIAFGNHEGLLAEHQVPGGLKRGSVFQEPTVLSGQGPWWVAFPGSFFNSNKDWGTGSRGLIIRSFRASLGGKLYRNPVVSFPVETVDNQRNLSGLNLELVPPAGVTEFKPGDTVEMNLEWITVPRVADDYYGPNKAFLAHLQQHPKSWETVYREAAGNDLEVQVKGGQVVDNYPVVIAAAAPQVEVALKGGVGAVPIRFEGLPSPFGYTLSRVQGAQRVPLDQSVHGNDFWQADYDAESGSYKLTFNLPLDGMSDSTWVLERR